MKKKKSDDNLYFHPSRFKKPITKKEVDKMVRKAERHVNECPDFDDSYDMADYVCTIAEDWYRLKAEANGRA
jgi:hypothetical protein